MDIENTNRNPGIAAVLSFIFSGLGQIYNGQILKGLVIFFLSAIGMLFSIFGAILIAFWMLGRIAIPGQFILGVLIFLLGLSVVCVSGVYSIVDAFKTASGTKKT